MFIVRVTLYILHNSDYTFALSSLLDGFLRKFNGTFSSKTMSSLRLKPRPKTGVPTLDESLGVACSAEDLVRLLTADDFDSCPFPRWMLLVLKKSEADSTGFGSFTSEIK